MTKANGMQYGKSVLLL